MARSLEKLKKQYTSVAPDKKGGMMGGHGPGGPGRRMGPRPQRMPKRTKPTVSRLLKYVGRYKWRLLMVIFCMLFGSVTALCGSYFLAPIIDRITLTVNPEAPECFAIRLRVPDFFENTVIAVNGEKADFTVADGYATFTRAWQAGDTVTLSAAMTLRTEKVGNRPAFLYGPLVLARDSAKEGSVVDLAETLTLATANGAPVWKLAEEKAGELVRITVALENGGELMLSDYASCG